MADGRHTRSREAEDLARRFHEAYEALAPFYKYETRRESAVPWEKVPEPNKALMIATAERVLGEPPATPDRKENPMPGVEHDPNAPIAPPGESLGDHEDDFPYPFSAEDLCPTCGSPDTRVSYERGVQDCSACGEEWPMQPSTRTTSEDRRNREAHRAARQQAYEDAALYHQVMGDNPQTTPDRAAGALKEVRARVYSCTSIRPDGERVIPQDRMLRIIENVLKEYGGE